MTATAAHWLRLKRSRCELAGSTAVRGGRTHAATHAGRSIRPAHCGARAYGSGWGTMRPPAATAAVEDKPRLRRAVAGPMTRVNILNIPAWEERQSEPWTMWIWNRQRRRRSQFGIVAIITTNYNKNNGFAPACWRML